MKTKLNIAEILRDKPQGTKLYSSACGKCELKEADDKSFKISFYSSRFGFMTGGEGTFGKNGNLYDDGECIIFPSKEMRDWSKFAWKKGDVLVSNYGTVEVIFDCFDDDTYASFKGKHALKTIEGVSEYIGDSDDSYGVFYTGNYLKESEAPAQTYIKTIEKKLGGKLNLETLEIEKTQPEFKNGDIAYADYGNKQAVFIVSGKTDLSEGYNSFIALDLRGTLDMGRRMRFFKEELCKLRLATEEEEQQLFDALAKENKAWDAEKKEIVDLKPKWTPKTFDRVITRDFDDGVWSANIFSHMNSQGEYVSIGCVEGYAYCLPYNEETAKLIGTTNNAK